MSKKINNAKLSHKSLIDLTREYHYEVCENQECIIYEKKIPKAVTKYGILTGMYSTSIVESKEIPIEYFERPEGSYSKLDTIGDGLLVLKTIFRIFNAK